MASTLRESRTHDQADGSNKVKVTILASEWGSSKGGLSTINREFAIQLAKFPEVEITFFLPQCSDKDKTVAFNHNVKIVEATRRPGFEELEWLSFPPEHLQIDIIVGHGVKLGHQAQVIRDSKKCAWVQVVHTDPEELGMFKNYSNPISKGEEKHKTEVELCEMADLVIGVGPKLSEAFRSYLRSCHKDQNILDFTPGIFEEFVSVKQVPEERKQCSVLVFGRGDAEDFSLKGFDIAGKAVAKLPDTRLVFVGAPDGKQEKIAEQLTGCGVPVNRLRVRGFVQSRESLKRLFQEVDLVLMPSRTEGFGLTGLEALSAGLPLLVCQNSGFGEAISSVPFGSSFVIDSEDPNDWAAAIKKIWKKDRKKRLEEAKIVRDAYVKKYNWAKQIKDVVDKMTNMVLDESSGGQSLSQTEGRMFPSAGQVSPRTKDNTEDHADVSHQAHIIERIRQLYKTREERVLPLPWCEHFSFHLNDIFTRLKIVGKEKIRGDLTDEITDMTAIFKTHADCQKPRTVLIEGEPGMGKTTYCQKLAYDWATKQDEWDESFPEIEVLLLLKCHEIELDIWKAIDEQILSIDIDDEDKESFFKFIRKNQSKVLLVLDGMDEADPTKLAMYCNLVQSKELPGCHIVLTSRHETGMKVRRYCDSLWEIVGFTEKDAQRYIHKYFTNMEDLAEKLLLTIWPTTRPWLTWKKSDESGVSYGLKELTQNPLNTALLCVVWEDFKGVLPTSRTQLYIEMVHCVLRRYEKKYGLSSKSEDLITVYKEQLKHLGRMALQSLLKGELYFEEREFDVNSIVLYKFGFLSIQAGGSKRKPSSRYQFLHKSFQEFFAGLYLAFQIIDGEIDSDSLVTDQRYRNEFNQVFLFMSGILASQSEEAAVSVIKSITVNINLISRTCYGDVRKYLNFALSCISECTTNEGNITYRLLHILGVHLDIKTLKVDRMLNIMLFSEALAVNSSLTTLNLRGNGIGPSGAASLSDALAANCSLTNLNLWGNGIGPSGAASLSDALAANCSLTNLNLWGNGIGPSGAASLSDALAANCSLTNLDLSKNRIGPSGAASFSDALATNSSLTNLDVRGNKIGPSGAASLSDALAANSSLTKLDLSDNNIGPSGAASLFNALAANSSLTNLILCWNGIGPSGAATLSDALAANCSLTNLDLSSNRIGPSGAASFSDALAANSTLTKLDLSDNEIGSSGTTSLSQGLAANCSLTNLDLRGNKIGPSGAASLSDALAANSSLTNLDLSWNEIGSSGAASLSDAVAANSSLTNLDFSWNEIGSSGAASLSDAVAANSSLTNLDLSWNEIGSSGAASLIQALATNSSLLKLNLRGNKIGASNVFALHEACTINTTVEVLLHEDDDTEDEDDDIRAVIKGLGPSPGIGYCISDDDDTKNYDNDE